MWRKIKMNEEFKVAMAFMITIILIIIIISGSVLLYQFSKKDFDKCNDGCFKISNDIALRNSCYNECKRFLGNDCEKIIEEQNGKT